MFAGVWGDTMTTQISRGNIETNGRTTWVNDGSKCAVRIHGFNRIRNNGITECIVRKDGEFIDIEVV